MKKSKYYIRPDGLHEAIRKINGKRIAFRGKSDREVDRKILEYKGEIEKGRLFKAVAEDWEKEHFPTLAANTLRSYRPALRRAVEHFGEDYIKDIKAPDIKACINDYAKGRKSRKNVATQLLILNLIFSYAVMEGDIEYSPCSSVRVPKNLPANHREAATPEDEEKIKASAPVWLLPFFILYTGLRKGEALALQYKDIDYINNEIRISKSIYHVNNKPYIKEPKTEAGVRTVPILDPLKKMLPKGKAEHYIFSPDGGKSPFSESLFRKRWEQYQRKTGITATPHQLRHSYATMLFEYDISVKDAQDLLGHSTAAMTQDVYTHLRSDRRKKTVEQLNSKLKDTENTQ